MAQPYLSILALQNAQWLHARQSLLASNVANASTPGFHAMDMKPFQSFLDRAGALTTTAPAHLSLAGFAAAKGQSVETDASDATLSGNSVNLEHEMVKLGDIGRALNMNTNIQRVFHQMYMAVAK
jgi:flagellar basal-body rod protein FlgB